MSDGECLAHKFEALAHVLDERTRHLVAAAEADPKREEAHEQGVALWVPLKPARNPQKWGRELEPRPRDSEAVRAWEQRTRSAEGNRSINKGRRRVEPSTPSCGPSKAEIHHGARVGQGPMRRALVCPGLQHRALRHGVAGVANPGSTPLTAQRSTVAKTGLPSAVPLREPEKEELVTATQPKSEKSHTL
jgi:hypothetical protein